MATELELTAHHEAAHFVIAEVFGHEQLVLTIKPTPGNCGSVSAQDHRFYTEENEDGEIIYDKVKAVEYVKSLYAGYCAQLKLDPSCEQAARIGSRSDFDKADNALEDISDSSGRSFLEESASLVETHWSDIQALAAELLIHETLSADEAECILEVNRGTSTAEDLTIFRLRQAASLGEQLSE